MDKKHVIKWRYKVVSAKARLDENEIRRWESTVDGSYLAIQTWVHPEEGWDKGEEIWTVIVEAGSKYKAKHGSDTYDIINDVPYSMALRVAGMWIRTHVDGKLWNEHDDDYLVYFNDHIYHQVWLPMPYPQWVEEEYPKLREDD